MDQSQLLGVKRRMYFWSGALGTETTPEVQNILETRDDASFRLDPLNHDSREDVSPYMGKSETIGGYINCSSSRDCCETSMVTIQAACPQVHHLVVLKAFPAEKRLNPGTTPVGLAVARARRLWLLRSRHRLVTPSKIVRLKYVTRPNSWYYGVTTLHVTLKIK